MEVAAFTRLLLVNVIWRLTGSRAVGRALVSGLESPDEDLRQIAGTFLVRGGRRARPLLIEAIEARRGAPEATIMLADLGDPELEPVIRGLLDDEDPEIASAARQALRVLEYQQRPDDASHPR